MNVVLPSVSIAFNNNATAVGLTHSLSGTVTLSASAPQAGTTIALSGDPAGIVSFNPASVTIPPGSTAGTFTLTGLAVGSTTITASAPGVTSGTANILVVSLGGIALPSGVIAPDGQAVAFNIQLQFPAPVDGTTVTLASSDPKPTHCLANERVYCRRLHNSGSPPQVNGIAIGSPTVTASSGGYSPDTETVKVTASLTLSPSTLSVSLDGTQNLNIVLSSPAPGEGVPVT